MDRLLVDFDPCGMLFLAIVLYLAGAMAVEHLPVLKNVGRRIGLWVFVALVLLRFLIDLPAGTEDCLNTAIGCGAIAVFATLVSWCVLPACHTLHDCLVTQPLARRRSWLQQQEAERRRLQAASDEEERRRALADQRHREAPVHEAAEQAARAARQRRADARARLEFLYHRHAPELRDRLPRLLFDELLDKYTSNQLSPEEVETRARQLEELVSQHCQKVDAGQQATTVSELSAWYETQKREFEGLPFDDRLRRVYLANLNRRFAELMTNLLERMKP